MKRFSVDTNVCRGDVVYDRDNPSVKNQNVLTDGASQPATPPNIVCFDNRFRYWPRPQDISSGVYVFQIQLLGEI